MRRLGAQSKVESAIAVLAIFVVTLAVNLQVPLYKTYAEMAGYPAGLVSVAFAAYVAGLIPMLLLLGGLPDRFGNKFGLVVGLSAALAAHAAIIAHPSIQSLLVMRVLQGVSMGLTVPAGTGYLSEVSDNPPLTARLSSAAEAVGLGSGGPITSAFLAHERSLVPASYYGVALATLACLAAVARLRQRARPVTDVRRGGIVRVPLITRETAPFGVAIFVSWALTGIILALVPAQLARTGHERWAGLATFVAIVPGVLVQLAPDARRPERYVKTGYAFVAASLLVMIVAVGRRATGMLFASLALSAFSGFGFTYVGGLTATLQAGREAPARAASGYYLLGYLGLGFPCIGVGLLADRWGLEGALTAYGLTVAAGLGLWRTLDGLRAPIDVRPNE
jgi:MFS family permease